MPGAGRSPKLGVHVANTPWRALFDSVSDAAPVTQVYKSLIDHVGAGEEQATGLLIDFRRYREKRTGKSQGPTNPNAWVMPQSSE